MIGKSRNTRPPSHKIGRDLAKVDAHVIQPEEYEELPELTDEAMARAVLSKGGVVLPNPVRRRGRPPKVATKQHVSLRLSPDVIEAFRSMGRNWQGKLDAALREWLDARR
jgi:uncharacterized protein (DUF4415 family)